jgi:hypothetical protein
MSELHRLNVSTSLYGPNSAEYQGTCSCGRFDKIAIHIQDLSGAFDHHSRYALKDRIEVLEACLARGIEAVRLMREYAESSVKFADGDGWSGYDFTSWAEHLLGRPITPNERGHGLSDPETVSTPL